jgi:glycosyltransferase involved in cell wall biosynthesis
MLAPDEQRFVAYLVDVLNDAALRERLSRDAVSWAAQFSWDKTAEKTLAVLGAAQAAHRREAGSGAYTDEANIL